MAITFLDEEDEIAPAVPTTGKRGITFLDEEEPTAEEAVKPEPEVLTTQGGRKITFLDEEPTTPTSRLLQLPEAPKTPEFTPQAPSEGVLRQAADLPVQFAVGINNSVKGLTDLFGADNPVSQNLSQNVDWYRSLLSASSKQDEEEVGRILKEAEDKGMLDQLSAGLEAFTVAPADFVASGLGSLAVFAAGGLAGRAAGLGTRGIQAVQAGLGAGMGAGIAKGEIYQSVKDEMLAQGKTEEESRQVAMEAQSFGGKNLDQILVAAGLGAASAYTGAEKIISKVLTKGGLDATTTRVGNILKTGLTEAVPEFAQAAQEKFASNLALQREGANVSLTQGIFSQGAMEGLVGLGLGMGAGAIEPRIQRPPTEPPTKEQVAAAASETQDVARQNKDVAPATASLVEGQAEQIVQTQETPEQRVARLQEEATAAAGIELEEEGVGVEPTVPVTPPVEPTPEGAVAPVEPVVEPVVAEPQPVEEVAPETSENVAAWNQIKTEFASLSEGDVKAGRGQFFAYNPDLKEEANVHDVEKKITVGPKFFEKTEAQRLEIIGHEFSHRLSDSMLKDLSAFDLADEGAFGPKNPETGKLSEGINGQDTPAENIAEAASLIITGSQDDIDFLKERYPIALQKITERMIQDGYPVSDIATAALAPTPEAAPAATPPAEVAPEVTPTPETPNLEPLRRVARAEQTEEDVSGLVGQGLVELYNGQPVITQAGLEALPEAERPRLNPEARKIQIDTGSNEVVAEAIAKGLRIGVDQVGTGVRMPAGWTLDGDIYVPPQKQEVAVEAPASFDLNDWVLANYPNEYSASKYLDPSAQYKFHLAVWEKAGRPEIDVEPSAAPAPEVRESRREPSVEIRQQYTPKTEEEQQSFDRASTNKILARSPQLAVAAVRMKNGEITAGEYADLVDVLDPFVVKGAEPVPTNEKIYQYMSKTAGAKPDSEQGRKKLAKIGAIKEDGTQRIPNGKLAEFRIDIPTYNESTKNGDTVYSITGHEPVSETAKQVGETIAHLGVAKITNPQFITRTISGKGDAVQIAMGAGKFPLATVKGNYEAITELPSDINDPDAWTEAGYNPVRSSELVDVRSKQAVVGGTEAIMVGSRVFVKNAKLEARPTGVTMGERYSKIQMPRPAGMEPEAVATKIESLGFGRGGIVSVVNEPDASFEGRTIIRDGKVVGIELNAAALKDDAAIERVLNHEIAESANADGALNKLVAGLTPKERKEINDAITRLGYAERARTAEEAARAVELLAEGWRGRRWFDRAVARVEAWANKLGYKLTRRAAEYIAARNVSEINAEFKQAYNKFINVQGEAREGRAFVTPAENARFLELAQNPFLAEANKEELQRLVNKAARKAKYDTKNLLFHGTTHIFNVFRRDRANSENDFGKGYYFTNTEDDALQNYAGEGPDLTNRIERLSEQIQANEEVSDEVARKRAKEILSGGDRRMIGAYIKMDNPFLIGGDNQTFLDFFEQYDEVTDEFGEPTGKLVDFINNFKKVAAEYENIDADSVAQKLYEAALGYDGLSAAEAVKILKEYTSDANDVNGDLAGNEIIRRTIEASGFDGIVDNLVNQKFGSARRIGSAMAGVGPETVHTIVFNSNQIKSADLITYDDKGNVIPLSQRFQPTEADIRYSIRESRREDAIPTFSEGSPEASTLSTMAASMAKVDAASEAKGPTTYKISEIASVWMDQGGDSRQLQDMVVEYTNLTPANAKKVANAIAKQYGLQQQIAETGAVIAEPAPEAEGAPRKSVVTRLIEQSTGVRKPIVKLQVSETAALKSQIRLKAREARETRKARKEAAKDLAKSITDYIKANPIRGPINARQSMSIAKRALKLDVNNESAVDRFEMYVDRVIENANYDRDLADARALIKRAKAYAKAKDTQGNVKRTLEAITDIAPNLLDNPFEFNLVVQRYLLGLAPVTAKQYSVMPDADVRRYLESLEIQISANQDVLNRSKAQRILDKQAAYAEERGIPLDEAIAILNSDEFLNEKTIEKLEDLTKLLTSMAQESQKDVKAYDDAGATPKQKELISFMRKVKTDSLDNEQKKRYIRYANNLLANGATFGMEQFQSIALGQEAAVKALKNKRLSSKLAAWISPIGGDKAIDTARRIALKTQSEADTFKNVFGREAVGIIRNLLGLNRLDNAQTESNKAKEKIANETGEYYKGIRKKYGDDATGFEAKGYAGVAGYLIQTDGIKTESESIPYRRRLMEQNIVELRKSDKQSDLQEADLKERALAQLTGTTNAEILSQLQALNPASYEQLMWWKDTMLPKWRGFLKEHDENFRNQSNNYNNPDHLTITYKFPEGQLLPNEIENVYQQDHIGMRIKQAANSIKRKDHPNLPVSPQTGVIANIDINFGYNQYNALVDQVDKAYVAPAWEQVVAFTKSPEFEQVMGGRANAVFVKKLLTDIQTTRTRQSMTDDESQLVAGGVRLARKISTQAVLGGFLQPLRQVPDQLSKLFLTTGRFDLITKNLLKINEAAPLMDKFPIGRRGDAQAGTQYASQFSELARKVEASVTDRKWAKYRELMNQVGEFWMAPLRGSDVWAAKVSWMTYYEAYLNKENVKMESWNREAELVDTDQTRKDAASYAEWAVDFYGGASDPTKMASLSKQTNNGWKEFAKLLFLPLNSFALQQKNSLISDLRDAYLRTGDRKASIAAIGGTLAGMAAFHGVRIYLIGGLIYPAGKALLMGLFGIDMDEPDEEEKQKQLEDNWRKFKASMYGNIIAGGAGEFAEKAAIDAFNKTAYLWDSNINPDEILNDKGELMTFRQYEKEVSPLYRFRSYGTSEYSFGLADVLTEQAQRSIEATQQIMTPEEMERYTGNEQAYAFFATMMQWMYFFRLSDTDVYRMADGLKRQMDKQVEEREKELQRIRSGR